MKKKLFTSLLALLLLTGCGRTSSVADGNSSTKEGSATTETSSTQSSEQEASSVEHVDYVNSADAKLLMDYQGKDFYTDGIGQVELVTAIDGDTARSEERR